MRAKFYIVIRAKLPHHLSGRDFNNPSVQLDLGEIRTTKKNPSVAFDEIAMQMDIEIPDSMFRKPMLTVQSVIPEPDDGSGVISAEIGSQIAEAIQNKFGVKVQISAPEEL